MPKLAISLDITASPLAILYGTTAIYVVDGKMPNLVMDFSRDFYYNDSFDTFPNTVTHSRAGNATMADSDGTLKWAPHNLLTYSEQFDNAAWLKVNATVTANQAVAPDGTNTADLVQFSAQYSSLRTSYALVSGQQYTIRIWVKVASGTRTYSVRDFNTSTEYGSIVATTEMTMHTVTFTAVSNGSLMVLQDRSSSGFVDTYIWGAHLYRSDLGGMVDVPSDARATPSATTYVPTTSSAVYLPRRGHHVYNGDSWVNKGLLHESEARTNLVVYDVPDNRSSSNTVGEWTFGDLDTSTEIANVTGPDGLSDSARELTLASGTGFDAYVFQIALAAGTKVTVSAYVKLGTAPDFAIVYNDTLSWSDSGGQSFTASNGLSTNRFERVSLTFDVPASGKFNLHIGRHSSGSVTQQSAGTVTVYGFQIEAGSTPSSYIPTAGSQVTRAAETLTVPAANLPWPSPVVIGEELVTNGTFDTDSDWNKQAGWTINGGAATHSDSAGYLSQDILTAGKVYEISFDVVSLTNPATDFVQPYLNNSPALGLFRSIGRHSVVGVALSGPLGFAIRGAGDITIDNISVKEINPLSVSIQMSGEMTYADEDANGVAQFFRWYDDASNYIFLRLDTTSTQTGRPFWLQASGGVLDTVAGSDTAYSPDINVPFNIASRHGSTFINGAVDGTALTANTTPVSLPDLSATDLNLGHDYMGTISLFRIWADDLGDTGIEEASSLSLLPSLNLTFDGQSTSFTDTGMVV